jgi:hypothetical protein
MMMLDLKAAAGSWLFLGFPNADSMDTWAAQEQDLRQPSQASAVIRAGLRDQKERSETFR